MKHLLLTTIAAVVLVVCCTPLPEPPTTEAPDISIYEAVKQHLAAGADVNAKDDKFGITSLLIAATGAHKKVAKLLISKGEDILCAGLACDS